MRLTRERDQTTVHHVRNQGLRNKSGLLFRPVDVRDALFADGVLFVEGGTEYELLRGWLAKADPTPQDANIHIVPVSGDTGFAPHMQLMDRLGVPWSALVDGPALKTPLTSYDDRAPTDSFGEAKTYWAEEHHVFTLATEFGTGERKGHGEIETFMDRNDPDAYEAARNASRQDGARGKVVVGTFYALTVPMPDEVKEIWHDVVKALRIHGRTERGA